MPRYSTTCPTGYDLTHELPFIEHDGVRYLLGDAGSLILLCPTCGAQYFRQGLTYWLEPDIHRCFAHPDVRVLSIALTDLSHIATHFHWNVIPLAERKMMRLKKETEKPWLTAFGDATEADFPDGHVPS